MTVKTKDDPHFVRAVARGLAVIECFDAEHQSMTLSEVAKRTGLTRGTAARFLHTLELLGYVRSDGRRMSLTPRTLGLGYAFLSSQPLWRSATPVLERAVAELGEPAGLSVLDLPDIVYVIATLPHSRGNLLRSGSAGVGTRLPAFRTAAGRVLLSDLPQPELDRYLASLAADGQNPAPAADPVRLRELIAAAREQGYAIQDEEIEAGYRAAAVPVRDIAGNMVGAINVVGLAGRWSVEDLIQKAVPILRNKAAELGGAVSPK